MTIELMKFETKVGVVKLSRLETGWYRVSGWVKGEEVGWSQTLQTLDEAERYYNKKIGETLL